MSSFSRTLATIASALSITNLNGIFANNLTITANTTSNNLSVTSRVTTGNLTVTSNSSFTGGATFSNTVSITGAATFSNTVSFPSITVGNTSVTNTSISIGNSTVNAVHSATNIIVANSSSNVTITQNSITSNNLNLSNTTIGGILITQGIFEKATVNTTPISGTVNFNYIDQAVQFFNSSSSANWVVNVRGNASTTFDSILPTGQSASIALVVTQGATAYYPTSFQIDGATVTVKWNAGTAPTAGDASSVNIYNYAIFKTAASTYTVFGSSTKFA
jgi:hypothetical protein